MAVLIFAARACLLLAILVMAVCALRHFLLAMYRLSLKESRDMMALAGFVMPRVSVLFSHRLLDVSAFRVARAAIGLPDCDVIGGGHRAQSDVVASIAKCKWHLSRLVT